MFLPSSSLRIVLPFSWSRSHSVNTFPTPWPLRLLWVNTLPSALPSLCAARTASGHHFFFCPRAFAYAISVTQRAFLVLLHQANFLILRMRLGHHHKHTGPFLLTGSLSSGPYTLVLSLDIQATLGRGDPLFPWPPHLGAFWFPASPWHAGPWESRIFVS